VKSRIGLLAVLISLTGCLHVRQGFVIPAHCVRVSVQSFTQPCTGLPDGKFVCNGVVITASCMAPPSLPTGSVPRKSKPEPTGRIGAGHFRRDGPDRRTGLGAACLGHILGLGGGPAGAGHIRAGTEIIVLPQTVRTHVDLVNLAMDHRQIPVANVATATDPSR
jgi:hypothetical protein